MCSATVVKSERFDIGSNPYYVYKPDTYIIEQWRMINCSGEIEGIYFIFTPNGKKTNGGGI